VITHIFIAPSRGAPMTSLRSMQALASQRLASDRYTDLPNLRSPDYQVTPIELENIEFFAANTGLVVTPDMPRRNMVTRGVAFNRLLGKRFAVGHAILEGLDLCAPRGLFAKRTHREVLKFSSVTAV
jgi:MOSC domain-containing protein YiiM